MKVELSRFHIRPDKTGQVDKWLSMLNESMDEVLQTLEREEMKLEVIFREVIEGEQYLYWISIQGEQGEPVNSSPFEVDNKHIGFFEECIDHEYGRRDAQAQVIMVPADVAQVMGWPDPAGSASSFQPREIIYRRPGFTDTSTADRREGLP
jgi:hypothetical protein